MSGTKGGSTTESEKTKDSKSKKRCESSMTKVDPSSVKISVPSKEKDAGSMSSLSDSVPRKKKTKTIAAPVSAASMSDSVPRKKNKRTIAGHLL